MSSLGTSVGLSVDPSVRGGADTRRRLLDAAAEHLARVGYESASLAAIARSAGLTTGAVYSTFGSKRELLRGVVRGLKGRVSVNGRARSTAQEARRVASDLYAAATAPDSRDRLLLQLEVLLLSMRDETLLHEVVRDGASDRVELSAELAALEETTGERLALSPDRAAAVLQAVAAGLQLAVLLDPDAISLADFTDTLTLLMSKA